MMQSPIETVRQPRREETGHSTLNLFSGDEPRTPEWWSSVYETGLIYAVGTADEPESASALELAVLDESNRPISHEFLDILSAALESGSAFMEELRRWNRKAQEEALQRFIAREAAKLDCVLAIKADYREDALDLLFAVEGDLFEGERTVLPLMRRLRDNFPDIPFDVMVLPASGYSSGFEWGLSPRTLFERKK